MVTLMPRNLNRTAKYNAGRLFVPYSAMNMCLNASNLSFEVIRDTSNS